MDPDKSAVFAYDGVPGSHLDLAIPSSYVHSLCFPPRHQTYLPKCLRWLDWIFFRGYLPSLSINYVAISKDMEKRFPQVYCIKMKIFYDLGFIAIGVAMAT